MSVGVLLNQKYKIVEDKDCHTNNARVQWTLSKIPVIFPDFCLGLGCVRQHHSLQHRGIVGSFCEISYLTIYCTCTYNTISNITLM